MVKETSYIIGEKECIVAGLCSPCRVVRRHVIRDVHKYCDAYVLHSQGSLHSNNTVVTVP